MMAAQPVLFADLEPANVIARDATTTTDAAPVLYRCRPCERRTGRPHVWRRTFQRTSTRAHYEHPALLPADVFTVEWTIDGRTHLGGQPPTDRCPGCKLPTMGAAIAGTYSATRDCDARCMYAKGPTCVCSCGGKNHGIGFHTR